MPQLYLLEETFELTVNGLQPLQQMIDNAHFRHAPRHLLPDDPQYFRMDGPERYEVQLLLARVQSQSMTTADVICWMRDQALRPANFRELLALAASSPPVRITGAVWAAGAVWLDPMGRRRMAGCKLWSERRLRLSVVPEDQLWSGVFDRFLCVPASGPTHSLLPTS